MAEGSYRLVWLRYCHPTDRVDHGLRPVMSIEQQECLSEVFRRNRDRPLHFRYVQSSHASADIAFVDILISECPVGQKKNNQEEHIGT